MIAARTDEYLRQPRFGLGMAGGDPPTHSAAGKARLWQQTLAVMLQRLNRAGVPVLVVHPVPALPYPGTGCAVLRVLRETCGVTLSRTSVDRRRELMLRVENAAIAAAPRSSGLDFIDDLCDARRCTSTRDGLQLYRDEFHLSVAASLSLADPLAAAIEARARR